MISKSKYVAGVYEIQGSFSEEDIIALANNEDLKSLLIDVLKELELKLLEKHLFSKRKDVELRVSSSFFHEQIDFGIFEQIPSVTSLSMRLEAKIYDYSFLKELKKLKELSITNPYIQGLDFLREVHEGLNKLELCIESKSSKNDISEVLKFKKLNHLTVWGGKNLESIAELSELQKLSLRHISIDNLDFVESLGKLTHLWIRLGGIKNFNVISKLTNLEYLELWFIRGLADLDFVAKNIHLKSLFIETLKNLEVLPQFDPACALENVEIANCKMLNDFSSLQQLKNLKTFRYLDGTTDVENLYPVLENKSLKHASVGYASQKKIDQFNTFRNKKGIQP